MIRLSKIIATAALVLFGTCVNLSYAQLINQRLIEDWSDQKILSEYKKRFVTIKLSISQCTDLDLGLCGPLQDVKVGAGFFVSGDGTLITALHNITLPVDMDSNKIKSKLKFEFVDSHGDKRELTGKDYTMIYPFREEDVSKDIAIFRLANGANKVSADYFCTSTSPTNVRNSGQILALKWRREVDGSNDDVERNLNILPDENPGVFVQTDGSFQRGSSGSPIVANGRVVGIITSGFRHRNNSGLFSPLSLVSHANEVMQSFGECALPDESLIIGPLSQKQFMQDYGEGSLAWIRGYSGKVDNWRAQNAAYHVLNQQKSPDRIESYRIGFSELATGDCSFGERELMLVFNHHFPQGNSCDITFDKKTWYQIQITPRVKEGIPLQKRVLVHRSGTFLRYDEQADKYFPNESKPNRCIKHRCWQNIYSKSPREFGTLNSSEAAIATMDQEIDFQWHGLTRPEKSSNTHIANDERAFFWKHEDIVAESNYFSKNFLVRYFGNPGYSSNAPPAVNVCVSKDWQFLSVKWSSPERCVRRRTVRIHLNSAD